MIQKFFWPAVIIFFPFYSSFEKGVELKFYGSIFLMLVTTLSLLLYDFKRGKELSIVSAALLAVLFFNRVPSNALWVFHFTCTICALLLLNQIQSVVLDRELREKIYWAIGIVGILASAHMIFNYYNIDPWWDTFSEFPRRVGGVLYTSLKAPLNPWGLLGNQNHSSMIAVMAVPFLFNKRLFWGLPIAFTAVYLSKSAMSIGSMVGSLGVMLLLSPIKLIYKVLAASIGAITFLYLVITNPNYFSAGDRMAKWVAAIDMVDKPFGMGLSHFRLYFTGFAKKQGVSFQPNEMWAQAHNEYIELYVLFGIFILPILGYFLIRLRPNYKNAVWVASFTAIMLNSLGNFPWHLPFLALLGIITYSVSCINKESL